MPRRTQLAIVASVLALAVACGNRGSEPGPREAGSVTAVSGTVTALRGAEGSPARALSLGDVVFSDDTITTGPSATVTITLSHNSARWTLGGDTARRIDRSAAWRAPKGSSKATFVTGDPDRTASAGRHTEATPEVERAEQTEVKEDVVLHAPPAAPAAAAPPPPPPKPTPDPERKLEKRKKQRRRKAPPDDHQEDKDKMLDGMLDDEVDGLSLMLTHADIVTGIKRVLPAVMKCGEKHDAKGVVVKVKILIARDGSVSGALPMGDHAKTDLGRCVAARARAARFPANAGPSSVIYPFRL